MSTVPASRKLLPPWLLYAVTAATFWGIWGVLAAPVTDTCSVWTVHLIFTVALIPSVIMACMSKQVTVGTNKVRGLIWGFIAGILAAAGNIAYYYAVTPELKGSPAIVIPMTNIYPLVTIVIALIFFKERMNWIQGFGIVLALIAAGLLGIQVANGGGDTQATAKTDGETAVASTDGTTAAAAPASADGVAPAAAEAPAPSATSAADARKAPAPAFSLFGGSLKIPVWVLYAFGAMFFWGVFSATQKVSTNHISAEMSYLAWVVAFVGISAWILVSHAYQAGLPPSAEGSSSSSFVSQWLLPQMRLDWPIPQKALWYALIASALNGIGVIAIFAAYRYEGKAAIVTPLAAALQPVVTVVLSLVWLRSSVNLYQWLGIGIVILASIALSIESKPEPKPQAESAADAQ